PRRGTPASGASAPVGRAGGTAPARWAGRSRAAPRARRDRRAPPSGGTPRRTASPLVLPPARTHRVQVDAGRLEYALDAQPFDLLVDVGQIGKVLLDAQLQAGAGVPVAECALHSRARHVQSIRYF